MNAIQRAARVVPLVLFAAGCSSSPPPGSAPPAADASFSLDASPPFDASAVVDGGAPDDAAVEAAVLIMGVDAAACASKPTTGDFPPDVAAVLEAKCQTCHKMPPINHAPFPLLTYEDTLALDTVQPFVGAPIWEAMSSVIQPGAVPHMPFGNAPQLSSAEYQTLYSWLFACALPVTAGAGDASDDGATSPGDASSD